MREHTVFCGETTIPLGRAGENLAQQIVFNVSGWLNLFGDGSVSLLVRRPGDEQPYPVTVTLDKEQGQAIWTVSKLDTAKEGFGQAELLYLMNDTVVKSRVWQTYVAQSLDGSNPEDPTEDPWAAYVTTVTQAAAEAQAAAQKAQEALEHGPKIENGTWWLWSPDAGSYVDTGTPAEGPQGPAGPGGLTQEAADQRYLKLIKGGEIRDQDTSPNFVNIVNEQGMSIYSQRADISTTIVCGMIDFRVDGSYGYVTPNEFFLSDNDGNSMNIIIMNGKAAIIGLSLPEVPTAAASKEYVDGLIGDINAVLDQINGEVV